MNATAPCTCADHLVFRLEIEGRDFLRCSNCHDLTPMPRRGCRLLNESRFLESLREREANDAPPDDRYPPIVGVLITLSVFALTVYVGWHVCAWMGRA